MKLVRPAVINDATLVSSNADESVPLWTSATTYALGDQARDDTTHRIYESVSAGNLNHAVSDAAWWLDVGPTNRWAMFDAVNGTATVGAVGLDVSIRPEGRVDSIGLLNVDAASARIIITDDDDGVIYDETHSLTSGSGVVDWYAYFYEPIVRKTALVLSGLPLYAAPLVRIILDAAGDPVSLGTLIVGQAKTLGQTQLGAKVGIKDFSRKETDDFGVFTVVERAFSDRGSFTIAVEPGLSDEVKRLLALYRAQPVLYIGSSSYDATAIFGFWREFNVDLQYPTLHLCSLEIEGLT